MNQNTNTNALAARGEYNRLCLERGIYVSGEITAAHEALIEAVVSGGNVERAEGADVAQRIAAKLDGPATAKLEQQVKELGEAVARAEQQLVDLAQRLKLYVSTVEVAADAIDKLTRQVAALEKPALPQAPVAPTAPAPAVASNFFSGVSVSPAPSETQGNKRRGNGPNR
jgi:polyhydroxyalkanoate synthesis regulator phasin